MSLLHDWLDDPTGTRCQRSSEPGWWLAPSEAWWAEHGVETPEATLGKLASGELKLPTKDRELAEAMTPLVTREYRDARAPFKRLVQRYPDEKEAGYGLGEAYYHDGQPQFNVGLYPGKVSRKPLVSPGIVKILCEVHPWMTAYIVVTEHPYHAVTDVFGEYEIRDVPPGTYRLKVWHESLGTEEKQVEVKGGTISKADFSLSLSQGVKK